MPGRCPGRSARRTATAPRAPVRWSRIPAACGPAAGQVSSPYEHLTRTAGPGYAAPGAGIHWPPFRPGVTNMEESASAALTELARLATDLGPALKPLGHEHLLTAFTGTAKRGRR